MTLSGNNTFTGATTVSGGTLMAAGTGVDKALGATSDITVNTSGTLILNTANQINTSATMTLNGGTVDLAGNSQGSAGTAGLGSLILQATSILDFGTMGGGANSITFGGFGGRTGGAFLNITDYDFNSDHLYFAGSDFSVFTSAFGTNDISFNGTAGFGAINHGSYYEIAPLSIVPVPEPTTILGAAGLLGFVGYRERRRLRGMWNGRIVPGVSFLGFLAFAGLSALVKAVSALGGRR